MWALEILKVGLELAQEYRRVFLKFCLTPLVQNYENTNCFIFKGKGSRNFLNKIFNGSFL